MNPFFNIEKQLTYASEFVSHQMKRDKLSVKVGTFFLAFLCRWQLVAIRELDPTLLKCPKKRIHTTDPFTENACLITTCRATTGEFFVETIAMSRQTATEIGGNKVPLRYLPQEFFFSFLFCSVVAVVFVLCVCVRGTQREYSSKPLKHSFVKRVLVFKQWIWAYFYPL